MRSPTSTPLVLLRSILNVTGMSISLFFTRHSAINRIVRCFLVGISPIFIIRVAQADSPLSSAASFLPIWKLLSPAEKQQFVAGYVQGWADAARVTDIAIDYVREHPQEAISGLEHIRALYRIQNLKPGEIVHQ